MKQKTKMCLKLGILFFGISLCVVNCQQDDLTVNESLENNSLQNINKSKLKRISFDQFKEKANPKAITFIESGIDDLKSTSKSNNKTIYSLDNSFSLSTDEIIEVTTDSTVSYTFNIINKLYDSHDFERFVIQERNQQYYFYIFGFTLDEESNDIDLPYSIEFLNISSELVDINEFSDFLMSAYIIWSGGCFWNKWYDAGGIHVELITCPDTGGGSGTGNTSDGGFTGNSDGYFGDSGGSDGGDSGGGSGSGGGSSDSSESDPHFQDDPTNDIAPFGIENVTSDKDDVIECLGGEDNLTPEQLAWLNSTDSNIEYIIKQMAHYIKIGGCDVMNSIIQDFIDNPTNDFVDFVDQELECYGINNLTTNVYFNQALSNLQGYSPNHPTEEGYEVSMSSNGAVISTNYVPGDAQGVTLNNGGNIIGGMHLHTNLGENMFSGEDIYNLLALGANVNEENSVYDCFSVLDTANGTYMIKISNILNLHTLLTLLGGGSMKKGYNELNNKFSYFDNTDETAIEREFLNIFNNLSENYNFNKSPINLFKYNTTNDTFDKLELDDNGQPDTQPCN